MCDYVGSAMELNVTTAPGAGNFGQTRGVPDDELERLITNCAKRDTRSLQRLYEVTAPQLLAVMIRILKRRALAEEALQDVFVSVWQRASQY